MVVPFTSTPKRLGPLPLINITATTTITTAILFTLALGKSSSVDAREGLGYGRGVADHAHMAISIPAASKQPTHQKLPLRSAFPMGSSEPQCSHLPLGTSLVASAPPGPWHARKRGTAPTAEAASTSEELGADAAESSCSFSLRHLDGQLLVLGLRGADAGESSCSFSHASSVNFFFCSEGN